MPTLKDLNILKSESKQVRFSLENFLELIDQTNLNEVIQVKDHTTLQNARQSLTNIEKEINKETEVHYNE